MSITYIVLELKDDCSLEDLKSFFNEGFKVQVVRKHKSTGKPKIVRVFKT